MLTPAQHVFDIYKKHYAQIGHHIQEEKVDYVQINNRPMHLLEEGTNYLQQQFPNVFLCLIKIVTPIERLFCLYLKSKERPDIWATMSYSFTDTSFEHFESTGVGSQKFLSPYEEIYAAFIDYVENMNENRLRVVTTLTKG